MHAAIHVQVNDCTFTVAVGKVNGLAVAGEVLTALGGANVAPTHRTMFLPNDAAFAALVAALSESTATMQRAGGSERTRCDGSPELTTWVLHLQPCSCIVRGSCG